MKLAQFKTEEGYCIGVHHRGHWVNLTKADAISALMTGPVALERYATIAAFLLATGGDLASLKKILRFIDGTGLARRLRIPAGARLCAPLLRPAKIVALGLNYRLHAKEGNFDVPAEPVIFLKAGSSVIGPGEPIRLPRGLGRMDHEVELAVVIGRTATGVKRQDAYAHVAGYTVVNDVTARAIQAADQSKKYPWFRSKSYDTFTPMGPWMVTPDEIRVPVHLDLECRVNGRVRQRSNTRKLIFSIPEIIEFVSRYITLEPGDLISTGTPEGIGPLHVGDTVTCKVEKVGTLSNPVRYR